MVTIVSQVQTCKNDIQEVCQTGNQKMLNGRTDNTMVIEKRLKDKQ